MRSLGILASGRGSNARAIIAACRSGSLAAEVKVVIADRAGAGALEMARELGVPSVLIESAAYPSKSAHERALVGELSGHKVELLLLAGYRRLLTPFLVGYFYEPALGHSRILNIHPADTQAYQGLDGYRWALESGLSQTAITVHYVDEGMDTGAVVAQSVLPIAKGQNLASLEQQGLALEHRLYPEAIALVLARLEAAVCAAS